MYFTDILIKKNFILTEGSVVERIRRHPTLQLNQHVANALLRYDGKGREVLNGIYKSYIDIAKEKDLPVIILTPTWRANKERIEEAGCANLNVNEDNYEFLNEIRKSYGEFSSNIFIGGLIGCANDAYKPDKALTMDEAEQFHSWQLEKLCKAEVDILIASTLPNINEAAGIAKAMTKFDLPYILSFIIRRNGTLLDGTPLHEAIAFIDLLVNPHTMYYMLNCVHPSIVNEAFAAENKFADLLKERIIGIQANTSPKTPEELEGSDELHCEDPQAFANGMYDLHKQYGFKILGGCCGTDETHIAAIAEKIQFTSNMNV